jgi:nucleotide-binding universal stress UspA family protein
MFEHVLVGVDGRSGGRDAIALASRLAAPGARMTLANVHARDLYRISGQQPRFDAILSAVSAELLERERMSTGVLAEITSTGESSVAGGLHELAEQNHADLLVIGSCRHTVAGRVFLGNDTKDALRGSPCAVAVAPKDYAEHSRPVHSFGVGYDGQPESKTALSAARALAAERDAAVHLLYAVSPVVPGLAGMAPVPVADLIEPLLQQGRERLAEVADADGHAVLGEPAEMLRNFSRDMDLLIVGSCAHGALARVLLGSTGEHVAQTACCPVLVVPRSAAPQAASTGGSSSAIPVPR